MSRFAYISIGLVVLIVIAFLWNLMAGAVAIPTQVVLNTLFDLEGDKQNFIINRSRLPRSLLAALTGASLALSGAIIQALLRNPLASPKIIGVNSGAALGVLLASMTFPSLALTFIPLFAIAGAVLAALIIYVFAELRPVSPARLALVGIAVGFTCDAGVDFLLVTADTYEISAPLVWLTGSLWGRGWQHLHHVWPWLIPLIGCALLTSYRLDLIRLGAAQATSLGLNIRYVRLTLLSIATLLAAISVSAVGVLGFVGLMAPHIARTLVGGQHKHLLVTSMLVGTCLVLLADVSGRALLPPIEVPAGIFTALFGAPFFIFILLSGKTESAT